METGFDMALGRLRSTSQSNPTSKCHNDDEFAMKNPMPNIQSKWTKRTSKKFNGATYYYNAETGESQWHVPKDFI